MLVRLKLTCANPGETLGLPGFRRAGTVPLENVAVGGPCAGSDATIPKAGYRLLRTAGWRDFHVPCQAKARAPPE